MTDSALDDAQLSEQLLIRLQQRRRRVGSLIFDYGLGVAILGLNPFPGFLRLTLLLSGILILKMLRDIAAIWGFPTGQDWLAIASSFFGAISSLWLAFMVWGTMLVLGIFLPLPGSFGVALGLFTLTCGLGQATNDFYASGFRLKKNLAKTLWWRFWR